MTTTEDQVRAGLAGLAPTAPADDAAFAGVGRAITRRRRRRTGAQIAAIAALALVVVGGGALVADRDETPGYQTDTTTRSTTTPSTTTSSTPDTSERMTFGNAAFEMPAGWTVLWDGPQMCVGPADAPDVGLCPGVGLSQGELVGHEGGAYVDHGQWSWYTSTDAMPCPNRAHDPNAASIDYVIAGEAGMAPVDSGTRSVGDRTAVWDEWAAECDTSGFTFSPQAWHLTEPEMLIVDLLGRPETEAMLASFEFTEDGADTAG